MHDALLMYWVDVRVMFLSNAFISILEVFISLQAFCTYVTA